MWHGGDQELERQLAHFGALRPDGPDRRRDLTVRQRLPALDDLFLRAQDRKDTGHTYYRCASPWTATEIF